MNQATLNTEPSSGHDAPPGKAPPVDASKLPRLFDSLRFDIPGSIVVFLVAVPLCLGIALASGAPLMAGVIGGVIGGIVIASLSGSELSISGPAAGLAVICAESIQTLGSFEYFLVAIFIAGAIQILFGLLKLGGCGEYVPNSVIKGMLAGIGIVIILKQLPHALGRDLDFAGDEKFTQVADGENTISSIMLAVQQIHMIPMLITCISLIILMFWDRLVPQRFRLFFPAPLIVVAVGAVLAGLPTLIGLDFGFRLSPDHFVQLPVFGSISEISSAMHFPDWSALDNQHIWKIAITVAIVASIESLLSIEASDKIDPYRRISSTNKELFAQGIGNMTSGLIGGLPLTSVIIRSSANIYAGSRTRMAGFLHGVWILVAVIFAAAVLNQIPLASLASILIYLGYKLASPKLFKEIFSEGYSQFLPFIVTIVGILLTDLLTGVVMGLILGLYFVVKTNHHDAITTVNDQQDYLVRFNKDLSFLNKVELKKELATIPDRANVVFDGTKAMFIDHDIYEILADFRKQARHRGITIAEKNMDTKFLPMFNRKGN